MQVWKIVGYCIVHSNTSTLSKSCVVAMGDETSDESAANDEQARRGGKGDGHIMDEGLTRSTTMSVARPRAQKAIFPSCSHHEFNKHNEAF